MITKVYIEELTSQGHSIVQYTLEENNMGMGMESS